MSDDEVCYCAPGGHWFKGEPADSRSVLGGAGTELACPEHPFPDGEGVRTE